MKSRNSLRPGRAPGRPKPTRANRGTWLALVVSKLAQASLEPRHLLPSGDRGTYSFDEGRQ